MSSSTSRFPTTSTPPKNTTALPTNDPVNSSNPAPTDPERTVQARAAVTTHLNAIGSSHLAPLQSRAGDISSNSAAIENQKSALEEQTKDLEKESGRLKKEADKTGERLKELGDIQNWAEVLERDITVLEETVTLGEGGEVGWESEEAGEGDGQGQLAGERRTDAEEGEEGKKKSGGTGVTGTEGG